MHTRLVALGWDALQQRLFEPYAQEGLEPGRVTAQHRGACVVATADAELWAESGGTLRYEASGPEDLPATGDWIAFARSPDGDRGLIRAVLPRRTAIVRKGAGRRPDAQVLAANADLAFIVLASDAERNAVRLERYLAVAWDGGAEPVVVLAKSDLAPHAEGDLGEVARGLRIVPTSVITGAGIETLAACLRPARSAVLLGPSGAGKSSLLNALHGSQVQPIGAVRASDGRGRHTTVARELITLPSGGTVIDTPGLRELALWDGAGLERTFEDVTELVDELAASCRFRDCRHEREPGCAVQAALEAGELDAERLGRYRKLQREVEHLEARKDPRAAAERKKRQKAIVKESRRRAR